MTPALIRRSSFEVASALGFPQAASLPLLEADLPLRNQAAVVARCLAMFVVLAAEYGFPSDQAAAWLEQHDLRDELTPTEAAFLAGEARRSGCSVEALEVLAWALRQTDTLNLVEPCSEDLVTLFPHLDRLTGTPRFQRPCMLRPQAVVLRSLDLAYCLHWGLVQATLDQTPIQMSVPGQALVDRRRALEWLLATEAWDDLDMST